MQNEKSSGIFVEYIKDVDDIKISIKIMNINFDFNELDLVRNDFLGKITGRELLHKAEKSLVDYNGRLQLIKEGSDNCSGLITTLTFRENLVVRNNQLNLIQEKTSISEVGKISLNERSQI